MKLNRILVLLVMLATGSSFFAQTTMPSTTTKSTTAQREKKKLVLKKQQANASIPSTVPVDKPKTLKLKKVKDVAPANVQPTLSNQPAKNYQPKATQTAAVKPKKTNTIQSTASGEMYNGHQVMVGSRGGKYYINKNGNKTYIK